MPVKSLPNSPSLDHLKYQAKDLMKGHAALNRQTLQRLREFLPQCTGLSDEQIGAMPLRLADAQYAIAREYGYSSWVRLKAAVEGNRRPDHHRPRHELIEDPLFRHAVDLLDDGDVLSLAALLRDNPDLVHRRVSFENVNYFTNPTLIEFVAENPIRHDHLPPNIVEIAQLILDAGAKANKEAVNETLGLVASGRVAREYGVQTDLIDLLCDYGADADLSVHPALAHGEFDAAEALLKRGATLTLPMAAAVGRAQEVPPLLPHASREDRHYALAYAAQHGRHQILRILLEAGEDPNRYNPPGAHSHSTPLHQAVIGGHVDSVRILLAHGASLDLRDTLFNGTPLGWAEHAGNTDIAETLRAAVHLSS